MIGPSGRVFLRSRMACGGGGAMIDAATTEVLMAWGNPQEPPLSAQR